jgi:hypothetical protein
VRASSSPGDVRTRPVLPVVWHALVCGGLGCAFLVISAPLVWKACRSGGAGGPITPYHTTDDFLSVLLGTPNGSERLIHVFAALPTKAPVAVVVPNGDHGQTFTAFILTYFGWPREVRLIAVNRENARRQLQALDQASLSAIFFCGVTPPKDLKPVIRLGTDLVIVPTVHSQ